MAIKLISNSNELKTAQKIINQSINE